MLFHIPIGRELKALVSPHLFLVVFIFSCAYWHLNIFSGKMSVQILCLFVIGENFLSILDTNITYMTWVFIFLIVSPDTQKFYILMSSSLSIFPSVGCAFGIIFRKPSPNPGSCPCAFLSKAANKSSYGPGSEKQKHK